MDHDYLKRKGLAQLHVIVSAELRDWIETEVKNDPEMPSRSDIVRRALVQYRASRSLPVERSVGTAHAAEPVVGPSSGRPNDAG